jgi:Phage integrase, N-terminal SAM-like domain
VSAMEFDVPLPSAEDGMALGGRASGSRTAIRSAVGGPTEVPDIVQAAGDQAVRAYREFLEDARWSANTRKLYGRRARRFLRWAKSRGLRLESIDAPAIADYAGEMSATKSSHDVSLHLTPVRALFRHLASFGVLHEDLRAVTETGGPQLADAGRQEQGLDPAELRAVREKAWAVLEEKYGDDPTFDLVNQIDRYLAVMVHAATQKSAEREEFSYAQ